MDSDQNVAEQIVILTGQVVSQSVPFLFQLLSWEVQTLKTLRFSKVLITKERV